MYPHDRFRQRGQGKTAGFVLMLILLAAMGGGVYWFTQLRSTPENTVRQFIDASLAKDAEAVKATLSESSKQLYASAPQQAMTPPGASNAAAKPRIGTAKVEGDKAEVPVTSTLSEQEAKLFGQSNLTMTMALVKEDGTWKIDLLATAQAMMKSMQGLLPQMPHGLSGTPAQ